MTEPIKRRIVASARQWIGTPYQHQASQIGHGCDCLGLVRGIWRELYGQEPEVLPHYTADWSEYGKEEALLKAAMRHLKKVPLNRKRSGDVVLFRMKQRAVAKHLGILVQSAGGRSGLIHAYSGRGVVETPLTHIWWQRAIAQFEFPDRTMAWQP